MLTGEMNVVESKGTTQGASDTGASSKSSSSSSKARLVFNTDGSVRLLGNPSVFPGTGIHGDSHALVPTIAADGSMTMLLTSSDGNGKSFILCPTNGASLPNLKTLDPQAPDLKKAPYTVTTNTNSNTKTVLPGGSSHSKIQTKAPVVTNTNTSQTQTVQKSLLSGLTVTNSSQYVTHMRIDPSGSSTSTVHVPVPESASNKGSGSSLIASPQPLSGSASLKKIAEEVKQIGQYQIDDPRIRTIILNPPSPTKDQNMTTVNLNQTSTLKSSLVGTQKYVTSSNHWTKLSSIMPPQTPTPVRFSVPTAKPTTQASSVVTGQSPRYVLMPSGPPGTNPGTYTIMLAPNGAQPLPSLSQGFQTVYTTNSDSKLGANTVLSSASGKTITIPSALGQPHAAKEAMMPAGGGPATVSYIMKNNQLISVSNLATPLPTPNNVQTLKQTSALSSSPPKEENSAKLVTGNSSNLSPGKCESKCETNTEDDIMSIKIDSVFSLSTQGPVELEDDPKIKQEPMDVDVQITRETKEKIPKPPDDKPPEIKCDPSYVVLEQLSRKQIENPKECIFKCSNHCRVRTLNFLCGLGLVDCKPVVYTVNPGKVKKEQSDTSPERKRNNSGVRVGDKTCITDNDRQTVGDSTKSILRNYFDGPSPKVRKIISPEKPSTKVLRFTKVDSDTLFNSNPNTPAKLALKSKLGTLGSIYPQKAPILQIPSTWQPSVSQSNKSIKFSPNMNSMKPVSTIQDSNKVRYFVFNHNGQKILVPVSNDLQKPKAFLLKSQTSTPTVATSTVASSMQRPVTSHPGQQSSTRKDSKSPTQTVVYAPVKPEPADEPLPGGIRIKSEPITHGYGDEKNAKPVKPKTETVKVKQEPVDTEWQEVWSSASRPVADPGTVGSNNKDSQPTKSSNKPSTQPSSNGSSTNPPKTSVTSISEATAATSKDDVPMPELPLMKIPSTKEIAQKTAASNDRIERLKAMLREKEKLIEELKMQRVESALEDEDDDKIKNSPCKDKELSSLSSSTDSETTVSCPEEAKASDVGLGCAESETVT